jgi:hypothetical protein
MANRATHPQLRRVTAHSPVLHQLNLIVMITITGAEQGRPCFRSSYQTCYYYQCVNSSSNHHKIQVCRLHCMYPVSHRRLLSTAHDCNLVAVVTYSQHL